MTADKPKSKRSRSAAGWSFRTTHWSVVLAAGEPGNPEASEALGRLCRMYWYPLYAYVRRRGYGIEEAQDLTQEFFARLLENNLVQVAEPERGRFRSFMLASLSNFLNNCWDRAHTLRRGAAFEIVSWDAQSAEERYQQEPLHEETPEKVFERRWALTVVDAALASVREEYSDARQSELFESLQGCLLGDDSYGSYAELGAKLHLSEGAVKVAVHRLRRRCAVMLRQVIAQTLHHEENIDEELRYLISALG